MRIYSFAAATSSIANTPNGGSFVTNEPAGLTLFENRPFDAFQELGWFDDGPPNSSIITDITAPVSPPNVLRMTYAAGFAGGSSPALCEQGIPSVRKVYIRYLFKASANFQGHNSDVNKHVFLWTVTPSTPAVYTTMQGTGAGNLIPEVHTQGIDTTNYSPNIVPGTIVTRGVWHQWETVLFGNSAGSLNGTIDWWLDGIKIGSATGLRFSASLATFNIVQVSPTWGGTGDTVTNTMTLDFDHIYISGV